MQYLNGLKTFIGVALLAGSYLVNDPGLAQAMAIVGSFLSGYGVKDKQQKYQEGGFRAAMQIPAINRIKKEQ